MVIAALPHRRRRRAGLPGAVAVLALVAALPGLAEAQSTPSLTQALADRARQDPNARMLVQANELIYDNDRKKVIARGNVEIYYRGTVVQADEVEYDQQSKRVKARGRVRMTQPDGTIVTANDLDFTDDFREGFINSLRVETAERTRFGAARADRTEGNITVFQSGVYTACEPCRTNPEKPPLWQVRAARIIHNEQERMVYFESAGLEFMGVPIAQVPFLSAPDPTVKRKTGVLMPRFDYSSEIGGGVGVPVFFNLAPDYDLTLTPTIYTRQGFMMDAEWRQRLVNGSYSIRAAGILQADPDAFLLRSGGAIAPDLSPGFRDDRGMIQSRGRFDLNDRWRFGWDATLLSDKAFLNDYNLSPGVGSQREAVSQVFLTGAGTASYFDLRSLYYQGLSKNDVQGELPVIHPVLDYSYTFREPVLWGRLGFNINVTSLSRESADFDTISRCADLADPRCNTALRGSPGSYTRLSAEAYWRTTIVDPIGQVWKPFISVRGDATWRAIDNQGASAAFLATPFVSDYVDVNDEAFTRFMPTFGLEYRYPFVAVVGNATHVIEPIGQLIVRPDETHIGRLPNEDAQSLVFDDTNLFSLDKFSGWDRVEGGGRLNYGLQYTGTFAGGAFVNVLVGQSYHLFGKNSFAEGDMANTGLDSGLESRRSDYVARLYVQPAANWALASRARFDEQTLDVRRFELEGRANFEQGSFTLLYGNYAAQPAIGYLERREAILGLGNLKLTEFWSVQAGARYNIRAEEVDQYVLGLSYFDDCFGFAIQYVADATRGDNRETVHRVMFQLSLRTLGDARVSTNIGELFGQQSSTDR